jgi:hypothetical protein
MGGQVTLKPLSSLEAGYERWLARTTAAGYELFARLFLEDRERRHGELDLDRLSAADVSEYVAAECLRRTVGGARGMVAKLRPLWCICMWRD